MQTGKHNTDPKPNPNPYPYPYPYPYPNPNPNPNPTPHQVEIVARAEHSDAVAKQINEPTFKTTLASSDHLGTSVAFEDMNTNPNPNPNPKT